MDERSFQAPPAEAQQPYRDPVAAERPVAPRPARHPERPEPPAPPGPSERPLDDPRALTILTTEHWSLLSARSLVYNEAFARAGMFLTFLSATLVALGLVSAGSGFSGEFLALAAVVLALDLFVGLATVGRIQSATAEDIRFLQAMNRLRHAYHETVPGLEPYFMTGKYDDMPGVFAAYGAPGRPISIGGVLHGFTTTSGMILVICAAIAGALAGVLVLLGTGSTLAAGLTAVATLVLGVAAGVASLARRIARFIRTMDPMFPSPSVGDDGRRTQPPTTASG